MFRKLSYYRNTDIQTDTTEIIYHAALRVVNDSNHIIPNSNRDSEPKPHIILITIKSIAAFKVIQGHRGRYQSKARMRLPISD